MRKDFYKAGEILLSHKVDLRLCVRFFLFTIGVNIPTLDASPKGIPLERSLA
ncbi:MAG: hypothetical protein PHP42_04285 [Bacteroidota bacterium]|nr:hypothetical protein [Bacteroidota bacterium]